METLTRFEGYGARLRGAVLLFGSLTTMLLGGMSLRRPMYPEQGLLSERIVQVTRSGDGVIVFSPSVTPAYPMLEQIDRLPVGHYLWTFPVAMMYLGQSGEAGGAFRYRSEPGSEEERRFVRDIVEDLVQRRPAVVVIQQSGPSHGLPDNFYLLEYFSHMDALRQAMTGYRFDRSVGNYALFVRAL